MAALKIPAIVEEFKLPYHFDPFDPTEIESLRGICLELANAAACDYLVLDLSETAILGAGFLGAVLLARRKLSAAGCEVVFSRLNPLCAEVLEITNLHELLRPPENISLSFE